MKEDKISLKKLFDDIERESNLILTLSEKSKLHYYIRVWQNEILDKRELENEMKMNENNNRCPICGKVNLNEPIYNSDGYYKRYCSTKCLNKSILNGNQGGIF